MTILMIKQLKKSNLPKINFIYSLFHKKKSFYHKKYYVLPQICAKTLNFCGITAIFLCLNDILSKFFKVFRKKREKFLVEKREFFVERPKIFVLKPFFRQCKELLIFAVFLKNWPTVKWR